MATEGEVKIAFANLRALVASEVKTPNDQATEREAQKANDDRRLNAIFENSLFLLESLLLDIKQIAVCAEETRMRESGEK
jgi:hypothetical protein